MSVRYCRLSNMSTFRTQRNVSSSRRLHHSRKLTIAHLRLKQLDWPSKKGEISKMLKWRCVRVISKRLKVLVMRHPSWNGWSIRQKNFVKKKPSTTRSWVLFLYLTVRIRNTIKVPFRRSSRTH